MIEKKFVFLSATPNPLLLECLEQSGLRYKVIEGDYRFMNAGNQDWNQICQPFTLRFHGIGGQTEAWVQSHYQEMVNWFSQQHQVHAVLLLSIRLQQQNVS